jgi:hypothetical protein
MKWKAILFAEETKHQCVTASPDRPSLSSGMRMKTL